MIGIPQDHEYHSFYTNYVKSLNEQDVLAILKKQLKSIPDLLWSIESTKHNYAYAPGKWTIKQVIQHLNDVERVFTYRALCFARGDKQHQPGMDQDLYVLNADIKDVPFSGMIDEFVALRVATVCLFERLNELQLDQVGTADGHPITVRALAAITAGHVQHHVNVLKERYLQ